MFNRNRGLRRIAAIVSISTLVTGCGILSSDSSEDEGPIIVGTTSAPSTLDPAASWDGSWELFRNVYQTLLSYPNGATAPQPDAAESCAFTDSTNQVYRCELREGLTFSNGKPLDAQAVKHSIDRIKDINVNGGPAGLLGTLDRVQAPSEREVVFHLAEPDATFPFVLATPAMSIVEPGGYPADALREDGKVVGSGPYALQSYEDGERAELVRNDRYKGFADRHNDAVTIRYFKDSAGMVKALRDGEIQVTYRGLAADDVITLQGKASKDEDLQLVEGSGTEIRYLVFNPEDPWAGKKEVRQAVAQVIDRAAIAHKIYQDTVDPLYSMVPKGLTGHTTGFFDDYGDPSADKARDILTDAGITESVPLTLWLHERPLRLRDRAGVPGDQAPARRLGPVRGQAREPPLEDVRHRLPEGRVPGVRARLVARLPGRGELHRALRRRAERARHALPGAGDHRRAAAALPPGERPRQRREGLRTRAADPRGGRAAAAAVEGQAVRGHQHGHLRRGTGHGPVDDHDDVAAVPQDQLVGTGGRRGRCQWSPVGFEDRKRPHSVRKLT